jgi:hypothetical protein
MFVAMATLSLNLVKNLLRSRVGFSNLIYCYDNVRFEQTFGGRITPVFIARTEVKACQMAHYRGHDYIAMAPWTTKIKIKGVILDILITGDSGLEYFQLKVIKTLGTCTYGAKWPSRQMTCNSLCD